MEQCELILTQKMCLKHCIRLIDRTHMPAELPLRLCDSYKNSLKALKEGIEAVKYSFNNPRDCHKVKIMLSADEKQFSYTSQRKNEDFLISLFRFPRKFRI